LREANKAVSCIETSNLTETSSLSYATAVVVTETLGYSISKPAVSAHNKHLPPWEYRLTRKIQCLRADLSRLVAMEAGNLQQRSLQVSLSANIIYHKNLLKKCWRVLSSKLEHSKADLIATISKSFKSHRILYHNQKQFYRQLNASSNVDLNVEPDVESIKQFWTNLWANSISHNHHSDWLATLKYLFSETVHEQEDFTCSYYCISVSNSEKVC